MEEGLLPNLSELGEFQHHEIAWKYINSPSRTRVVIKGNQGGGTKTSMYDLTMRCLKIHPVKERNRIEAPFRCVSKSLPKDSNDEENQQYVEFRRMYPRELIKRDVTARANDMILRDTQGGKDIKVEFMAKTQELDAFMAVQRQGIYQDEEIEKTKWDENQMRLLAYCGDTSVVLTPVRGLDWTFDHLWRRAARIYRSKTICKVFGSPKIEELGNNTDIEVFCWATDDNPFLKKESIEHIFEQFHPERDKDELAMRRYGVFKQVSGRIYKTFDKMVHCIPWEKVFSADVFRYYWHFRMIDYHPTKPWYVSWVAVSPTQEWYIWNEMIANHDRSTVYDLRDEIKKESLVAEDEDMNRRTLVDPLARQTQIDPDRPGYSQLSIYDHLTMGENGLRRCEAADTKNSVNQGRMNIRKRLKNALDCEYPGNNKLKDGKTQSDPRFGEYLPTLWFFDTCKEHIEHFVNWRDVEYKTDAARAEHGTRKGPMDRWSDFCRNIEFLGSVDPIYYQPKKSEYQPRQYYKTTQRECRI